MSQVNNSMNKNSEDYEKINLQPHDEVSASEKSVNVSTTNNLDNEPVQDNYLDHQINAEYSIANHNFKNKVFIALLAIAVVLMLLVIGKQHNSFKKMIAQIQANKVIQNQNNFNNQALKVLKSEISTNTQQTIQNKVKQVSNTQINLVLQQKQEKEQTVKNVKNGKYKKYLSTERSKQQLEQIIKEMKKPKSRKPIRNINKSTRLQDQVYFAFQLSRQPYNEEYLQAEYYYYDQKYNLSAITEELPICAVMVGRNLGDKFDKMISSILRQNYSNYHIVYADDHSDDSTKTNMEAYINSNSELKQRITVLWQQQQRYALYNRNKAIRSHCRKGDIVLDLDADDWLIGSQVFQIVNSLYRNQNLWACYFNNIIYYAPCKCPLMNIDTEIPLSVLESNSYRTSNLWRTTQLRTFRKDLFDKIQEKDFIDERGQYYKQKSDSFIHFSLVELAGPNHVKFLDQFLYYYDTTFAKTNPEKPYCRFASKAATPYKPLRSLNDQARKVQNYMPPQDIVDGLMRIKKQRGYF